MSKISSIFNRTTLLVAVAGLLSTQISSGAESPPAAPSTPPPGASPTVRPVPATPRPGLAPGAIRPSGPTSMRYPWLDQQQQELLRESTLKHRDELTKFDQQIRSAQSELAKVVVAEKSDEKALREKADALAKLQSEQTLLRAKIFSVVVPTLKPEQREQIENNPFAFRMLMESPMMTRPMMAPGTGPTTTPPTRK